MNELPAVPFRQTLAPLPVNVTTAYNAPSSKNEKTHAAQNTNSIQTPASRRVKAPKTPKEGREKAPTTAVEDSGRGEHRGHDVVYPPLHNALPTIATTQLGHHASPPLSPPPTVAAAVAANTVAQDEVKDTLTSSESAPLPLAAAAAPPAAGVADLPALSSNDEGRSVSLHPPTGAKPQMPSRRPSLARLRVPGRLSPQPPAPGSAETQTRGLDTADAAHTNGETSAAQQGSADGFDTAAKLALFSYRPDLTPAKETVFTPPDKILPGELRSPSGATSIAAAAAGDTSESASDTLHSSNEGHTRTSPSPPHNKPSSSDIAVTAKEEEEEEEEGKGTRRGMRNAQPTSSERPGVSAAAAAAQCPLSPESNAHFHALQFLPASSHDVFCSPPHSGRSEASEGGLGASSCAAGVSRTAKPSCGGGAACSEHKSSMGDKARQHRDGGGEAGEQMTCPLASLGCCSCCTGGVCTPAGVCDATALHRHLCAMATYVQRMQERQAELEKAVVALQRVVATQDYTTPSTNRGAQVNGFIRAHQRKVGTVKSSSAMVTDSPLQDGPHRQPQEGQQQRRDILGNITHTTVADVSLSGNTVDSSDDADGGSSQHNSANVSHTAPAVSSSDKKAAAAAAVMLGAGKAFPGDVSIREPHMTDDDDDDDDNGDDGEKNGTHRTASESAQESDGDRSGDDRCGYAGQLRLRTRSAQQLYALRDATESGNAKHLPVLDSSPRATPQRSARGTRRNTMPAHAGCSGRDTHSAGSTDNPERLKEKKKRARQRGTVGSAQRDTPSSRPLPTALSSPQPASSSFFFTSASAAAKPRGVAGSSTEVSGMSNVPPYQLREESVSTIRSGSCNLDDDEDDFEVGEMRQQLMNLSAEAKAANRITAVQTANAAVQQKGDEKEKERRRDSDAMAARNGVSLKQHERQHAKQGETSGPSIPSIISATYTPSQLAHSPAAAAPELPSNSNADVNDEDSLAESLAAAAATAAGTATTVVEMVRFAALLQRPTLIRKTDVVADSVTAAAAAANLSSRCAGGEQTHRTAPQLRPRHSATADGGRVPLAHLAGSSAMPPFFPAVSDRARPAAGIMTSNSASLKARRMREPDSEGRRISTVEVREQLSILTDENNKEAGLTGGASFSGVRVNARVQEAAEAEKRDVAAGRYCRTRSSSSAGFPQRAVSAHHTPSAHAPINGVIDRGEEDALRNRSGAESKSTLVERRRFAGSAGDGSARRRHDASRPRHGSDAAQRPQHATSMLSTREAAALGDGAPLSTPPY